MIVIHYFSVIDTIQFKMNPKILALKVFDFNYTDPCKVLTKSGTNYGHFA